MILYGYTHRVGDNITTGAIIAPAQRDSGDPALLAAHCLEAVDPAISERAREGDVLLAGQAFGAGPAPDVAVLALQAVGIAAVICASAAGSLIEAAEAFGLPVLTAPAAVQAIAAGTLVRIDLARGQIEDRGTGATYTAAPCSPEVIEMVRRAQTLYHMRRVVEDEGYEG